MAIRDSDGMIAIGGCVNSLHANIVCIYHKTGTMMKRVVTPCEKVETGRRQTGDRQETDSRQKID